jgi:hypothetical protein
VDRQGARAPDRDGQISIGTLERRDAHDGAIAKKISVHGLEAPILMVQ